MLYPSSALYPGPFTFPSASYLPGGRITPLQVAMGCGVGGAMVDVSAFVSFGDGISRSWGRQDEFRDTEPGMFSFTLFNQDGRFTPGNASSPLATTVIEGMPVCWNAGGRLVSGAVLSAELGSDESTWGQIVITCDDMLGNAARAQLTKLAESMVLGSGAYAYWPFNEAAGAAFAAETSGNGQPGMHPQSGTDVATFGSLALAQTGETQAAFPSSSTYNVFNAGSFGGISFNQIAYAPDSIGCWGFWFTPTNSDPGFQLQLTLMGLTGVISIQCYSVSGGMTTTLGTATGPHTAALTLGEARYFSMVLTTTGTTTVTAELFMDGVSQGTGTYAQPTAIGYLGNDGRTPNVVAVQAGDVPTVTGFRISHLSHTPTRVDEIYAGVTTEANRLLAIDQTTPEVVLDTLPADLSAALVGVQPDGGSVLDALNLVMRTEQGSIYTATSGTLLNPVQKLQVRARQRPTVPAYIFDADTDISDTPKFIRDITNMVSKVIVTGPTAVATVTDSTVTGRAGTSSASETILSNASSDLALWGQDRLNRGKNVNLRVASITIDALTTPTMMSGDLLALTPGDRIRINNLPSAVLGFTSWDGWLLGASENHSLLEHAFVLFVCPVLPDPAVYDTSLYMAGGDLSLGAALDSTATTMTVTTSGARMETSAFPYALLIDAEQVTVTACTTATPQVATITRAVNGTHPAAHAISALVEIIPSSLYAN